MGKIFKKATKAITKPVTKLLGLDAAKEASKRQANEMALQRQQEAQMAARAANDTATQTAAMQSMQESTANRDKAMADAKDNVKKAQEGDTSEVDVELGQQYETDETGRRVNTREQFMSSKKTSGTGLRL